jgi:hypothetical protein
MIVIQESSQPQTVIPEIASAIIRNPVFLIRDGYGSGWWVVSKLSSRRLTLLCRLLGFAQQFVQRVFQHL